MHKHKIELTTMTDIVDFVQIVSKETGSVKLVDDTGFCVSGKSLLGVMATIEWKSPLYCVSEDDIYSKIQKYCVS